MSPVFSSISFATADSIYPFKQMYRPLSLYSETSDGWPKVKLNYIGVFDPEKLDMARDPLTDLPMETYFPAKAWSLASLASFSSSTSLTLTRMAEIGSSPMMAAAASSVVKTSGGRVRKPRS
ncbi:hypothetical protein ACW7EJ_08640, partial [Acinetobacter soli]